MKHAAIPTVYKGVQMRSRLEARWAALFDICQWEWQYEPFDLEGWIPDFLLKSKVNDDEESQVLVEIKPITENRVPDYLTREILNAIGTEWCASSYMVMVLGVDPTKWFSLREDGTWGNLSERRDSESRKIWQEGWKFAGNEVQWKAPRLVR